MIGPEPVQDKPEGTLVWSGLRDLKAAHAESPTACPSVIANITEEVKGADMPLAPVVVLFFFLTWVDCLMNDQSDLFYETMDALLLLFSCQVVSDSLRPHGPQHTRPPCPLLSPRVCPNSCPLNQWCHPTISSSVFPFSSCLQSYPASGSFQMSQFFTSGGQNIGVSASATVPPINIQDWSSLGWTHRISLQSKGLSRIFSNTIAQKHQFFYAQVSL